MRLQNSEVRPQTSDLSYHLRTDFDGMEAQEIIAYLKNSHRRYENTIIPQIEQSFFGLMKFFPNEPSLSVIFNIFLKFQVSLELHMKIEEETIYKKSVLIEKTTRDIDHSHEEPFLDEIIACLRRQTWASNLFCQILLNQLLSFDRELQEHAWIEEHLI
jgi:hypothetical protein